MGRDSSGVLPHGQPGRGAGTTRQPVSVGTSLLLARGVSLSCRALSSPRKPSRSLWLHQGSARPELGLWLPPPRTAQFPIGHLPSC